MLERGTLWTTVRRRTARAVDRGALQSIPTDWEFVEQHGVRFLIRVLSHLARKEFEKNERERKAADSGEETNPFLPFDENLFVADISEAHVCLLNKFNAIDHHVLIVTRRFEHQECLLNLRDFRAMWDCMAECEGLAFYNGGKVAGASQEHKHLQVVPLPLAPGGAAVPVEPLLAHAEYDGKLGTTAALPFRHAVARLDLASIESPAVAAEKTLEIYGAMLRAMGLEGDPATGARQSGPYNLLVTREWMLLVPRSRESFESISVNSLGFAGSLFVRNERELEFVREHGPMTILKSVAVACHP